MHQIYSCSDENIEVFTTVIPSKVTSPARRRVKSSQHLLTKNVVIESDLYAPRPLELMPHRTDRRDGEGRRSGRFQNPRLQGSPSGQDSRQACGDVGTQISKSVWESNIWQSFVAPASAGAGDGATTSLSLLTTQMPPVARISVKAPTVLEAAALGSENVAVLTRGSRHLKKMTEEFPTLPQGAEASLPLTGSAPCGMPSILRKMWTRHKKKSEYVGATNSAFEAD